MTELKPFLDDMLSMSTGTDGRTLQIHFSRPVTKEDRQAFADAHNAIVRGLLSTPPETKYLNLVDGKIYELVSQDADGVTFKREGRETPHYLGRAEFDRRFQLQTPPPPETHVEQWRPWIDMPVGDQRGVVREVMSENGETALAYWTGKFMALAPVSDDPVELPFKVWGQRPPSQPITATAPDPHMLPPVVAGQMEIAPDVTAAELGVNAQMAEDDPPCTCCQDTGYDGHRERFCDCEAGIDALATTQQQLWGGHLRATGIARDPENDRTVFLSLTRSPNDDEIRAIHDAIRRMPATCPFCAKPTYVLPCSHCGEPDVPDDQF